MTLVEQIIDWVFIAMVVIAIVPLVSFVYRFHRYSPWRSTAIGRTLMSQKLAMIAMLMLSLAARFFGEYWLRPFITAAVFLWLIVLFWRTYLELVNTQKSYPVRDNWKLYWDARRVRKQS